MTEKTKYKFYLFFFLDAILGLFSPDWMAAICRDLMGISRTYDPERWNLDGIPFLGCLELFLWAAAVLIVLICLCWKLAQIKKRFVFIPIAVFFLFFGLGILAVGGWDVFLASFTA